MGNCIERISNTFFKELPRKMDEMMGIYLELVFKDKCIVEMNDAE